MGEKTHQSSGVGYMEAEAPKQDCNMAVLMTPGLSVTIVKPGGTSLAKDLERPSTAHLVAQ